MDLTALIAVLREHGEPDGVTARIEGEQSARQLLDEKAGRFDHEDAMEFCHQIQTVFWDGRKRHVRFMPALASGAWSNLLADLDAFNRFTERLWRGTDAQALAGLDEVYRDHKRLPWAAPSYPSLLMYLRDPERYLVAIGRLSTGLEKITGISYPLNTAGQYLSFCSSAHHLRVRYRLQPQEVDLLLWGVTEDTFASFVPIVRATGIRDEVRPAEEAPLDADELDAWLTENEKRAAALPLDYLASRADSAPRAPLVREGVSRGYVRNAYVSALAKQLADGHCDLCGECAPFSDSNGEPYLEAHHVQWLSRDGEDRIENVVALCPNCHRKMHVRDLASDVAALQERVSSRDAPAAECAQRQDATTSEGDPPPTPITA